MVYLSSDLIIIILGEKYIESLEIIYILLIAFLFIAISSIYGNLLISKGLNREYMYAMGIALAVNFILNYTFIPVYGVKVASITTVISAVITTIITWFYFKTKILDKKEGS
jgi:O-antigen/teichoic acid export membrane protein